jgi:hypothetical protein
MIHRLEQIIQKTVYCKGALAHRKSSPFYLSGNKILGEDFCFFQISITSNLGYSSIKLEKSKTQ